MPQSVELNMKKNFSLSLHHYVRKLDVWDYLVILFSLVFFIVGYVISIYAHQTFRSNAMDMGLYNQYVYLFSHFKYPAGTIYQNAPNGIFFLGDHTTFILPIESMFYWILGKNVLLYLQLFYLIVGAIGLYKLVRFQYSKKYLSVLTVVLYYLHYSIYNTLSFDFHVTVLFVILIPWLLYFYFSHQLKSYIIIFTIILLIREDTAIYMTMLGIFIMASEQEYKWKYSLLTILFSVFYFILVYKFILPMYKPLASLPIGNWRFNHIGNSIDDVIKNILDNPGKFISMIVDTPEKQVKIKYLLYSGGLLLFFMHWKYSIILIPSILISCLSNEWSMWGNFGHYNILFAIWMPYVIITFISSIKPFIIQMILSIFFLYQYFELNVNNYLEPTKWSKITKILDTHYYYQRYNMEEIKEAIRLIPDNASVSASMCAVPHLAFRERIYYFPDVFNAEYIAVIENDCNDRYYYLPSPAYCYLEINKYKNNKNYITIYHKNNVLVLKKK